MGENTAVWAGIVIRNWQAPGVLNFRGRVSMYFTDYFRGFFFVFCTAFVKHLGAASMAEYCM